MSTIVFGSEGYVGRGRDGIRRPKVPKQDGGATAPPPLPAKPPRPPQLPAKPVLVPALSNTTRGSQLLREVNKPYDEVFQDTAERAARRAREAMEARARAAAAAAKKRAADAEEAAEAARLAAEAAAQKRREREDAAKAKADASVAKQQADAVAYAKRCDEKQATFFETNVSLEAAINRSAFEPGRASRGLRACVSNQVIPTETAVCRGDAPRPEGSTVDWDKVCSTYAMDDVPARLDDAGNVLVRVGLYEEFFGGPRIFAVEFSGNDYLHLYHVSQLDEREPQLVGYSALLKQEADGIGMMASAYMLKFKDLHLERGLTGGTHGAYAMHSLLRAINHFKPPSRGGVSADEDALVTAEFGDITELRKIERRLSKHRRRLGSPRVGCYIDTATYVEEQPTGVVFYSNGTRQEAPGLRMSDVRDYAAAMHLPFVELCQKEFEKMNASAQGVRFPPSAHATGFEAARAGATTVGSETQRPEALWKADARALNWWR